MICLEDKTTQKATEKPLKTHLIEFKIKYLEDVSEFRAKFIEIKMSYLEEARKFRAKIQEEREKYGRNNN